MNPFPLAPGLFPMNRVQDVESGQGRWRDSLLVEDAGLLQSVLALGHVPHSDRPVVAAGGQQAFLGAPAAGDDLNEDEVSAQSSRQTWPQNQKRKEPTHPALVGFQLDEGALPQVPRHVGEGLRTALVVAVMGRQRADQLLGRPLTMLGGQPGRQAAGRQSVGQLQRAYSGGIMGRMGI